MGIKRQVTDIIRDQMTPTVIIGPETHLQNDLGADSLDMVELLFSFEEAFGLRIPDDEVYQLQTVQNAVDYIEECLNC